MDQRGTPVLRVVRGEQGVWEVQEAGFEQALSFFASMQDAKDYAEGIAHTKPGIVVEVYSADGRSVHTVIADGRVVVENHQATFVDEARLADQVQALGEGLLARTGTQPLRSRWPILWATLI
jgi:hypothetical protein